jgi:hypothetical protein
MTSHTWSYDKQAPAHHLPTHSASSPQQRYRTATSTPCASSNIQAERGSVYPPWSCREAM